jgi:hypothetical protein
MLVRSSRRAAVPQYLGLMVQVIFFAMHFANPKYWGTWRLDISYRLEENDMTGDEIEARPSLRELANPMAANNQAQYGMRNLTCK